MALCDDDADAGILSFIGDIYDCSIDPALRPPTLERISRRVTKCDAAIPLHDTVNPQFAIKIGWNNNPEFVDVMQKNFALNPFIHACWYSEIDNPFSAFSFYGEQDLKMSDWFQRCMQRFGYGDVALTVIARTARHFGGSSFLRMDDQPNYGPQDLSFLSLLAPHIRRAVAIADLLEARLLERDMLSSTLEMLSVGVILTDATARVVHANAAASRLISNGKALRKSGDELSAFDPLVAQELRHAIADAAGGMTIRAPRSGIVVPVPVIGGSDLAAWILPLDQGLRKEFATEYDASVAVFVRELGDTSPFPAELFVRRYGITPAECRVLMLISQGLSPQEAANSLGISVTTAKTQLARLFDKTGTQRQAELVRLTMSALAPASK